MLEIGNKTQRKWYLSNSYINFAVMSAINGVPLLVEGDPASEKRHLPMLRRRCLIWSFCVFSSTMVCLMIRFCTTMTTRNSY